MIKTMMKVLFGIALFVGGMFVEAWGLQMTDRETLKELFSIMED